MEDWVEVICINEGSYMWSRFAAYWSPSARRYFWGSASGCSCDSWEDYMSTEADYCSGDKEALKQAVRQFAGHPDAVAEVARFSTR